MFSRFSPTPGGVAQSTRATPRSWSRASIIPPARDPLLLVTPNAASYLYARHSTLNSQTDRHHAVPYRTALSLERFVLKVK